MNCYQIYLDSLQEFLFIFNLFQMTRSKHMLSTACTKPYKVLELKACTRIAKQEFTVAQNIRRAPLSRTLMADAHARLPNENFTVT